MSNLSLLLPEVEKYVTGLLTKELPEGLVYHNLEHTLRVVKQVEIIGINENLSKEEMNIVKIAAWFHDVGYLKKYMDHEKVSIKIATDFLKGKGIGTDSIAQITECINSTVVPQDPKDKISAVLCDADMMHMGMEKYPDIIKKLRKEWKIMGINSLSKKMFQKASIDALRNHHYHTDFCQGEITLIKERNLDRMESGIAWEISSNNKELEKNKKTVMNKYSRGADSMLRLTARNQISLSSIADNKSNILISLNGIIISLGLALLVRKFGERPEFIIPTLIFLSFSLVTIILAILSTRPQVSTGKFSKQDVRLKQVNLLFFGNFYKMDIHEYEKSVEEMFSDDPYLYSAMIKDQYYLGKVLARKYKLLSITYGVFMVGLIISVVSFILVSLPM